MSRRGIAVALIAVVALAVAGCGGGGGGKELTKAQYEQRVQADAAALGKAFASFGSAVSTPPS